MKALVTGASSGIGKHIAIELTKRGYDLILVATNKEKLEEVRKLCTKDSKVIVCDLRKRDAVLKLYESTKNEKVDIIVNNAGFGLF